MPARIKAWNGRDETRGLSRTRTRIGLHAGTRAPSIGANRRSQRNAQAESFRDHWRPTVADGPSTLRFNVDGPIAIEVSLRSLKVTVDVSPEAVEQAVREELSIARFVVITEIDMAAKFKTTLVFDRTPLKVLGA